MPDHFHGILRVKEHLPKPLGQVIRGFKAGTTKTMLEMQHTGECPVAAHFCAASLWSDGFQDTLLSRRGQLANMRAYILDNPRRLAIKRANPDLFRIVRDLAIGDKEKTFAAIGNHFLLDAPVKVPIQCSRSISPTDLESQTQATLAAAQHGAVAVSPCISPSVLKSK